MYGIMDALGMVEKIRVPGFNDQPLDPNAQGPQYTKLTWQHFCHPSADSGGIDHPYSLVVQWLNVFRSCFQEMFYGALQAAVRLVIFYFWSFFNGNLLHTTLASA